MTTTIDGIGAHLDGLERVWEGGMGDTYAFYRSQASPAVALAAAMVETALDMQTRPEGPPDPPHLLLGDLCLARASRLLAETRDQRLQVGFARAVERVASAAAGASPAPPLRTLLVAVLGEAG